MTHIFSFLKGNHLDFTIVVDYIRGTQALIAQNEKMWVIDRPKLKFGTCFPFAIESHKSEARYPQTEDIVLDFSSPL